MLCLAIDATGVRVLGGCVGYGTALIVAVLAVAAAAEVRGRGGWDTRLDAATTAGCRRAAWVAGCRRKGRGRVVGEGGVGARASRKG